MPWKHRCSVGGTKNSDLERTGAKGSHPPVARTGSRTPAKRRERRGGARVVSAPRARFERVPWTLSGRSVTTEKSRPDGSKRREPSTRRHLPALATPASIDGNRTGAGAGVRARGLRGSPTFFFQLVSIGITDVATGKKSRRARAGENGVNRRPAPAPPSFTASVGENRTGEGAGVRAWGRKEDVFLRTDRQQVIQVRALTQVNQPS